MKQPPGRNALLVFLALLPGATAALRLPTLLAAPPSPARLLVWRVLLALPIIILPALLALMRLQRYQCRAAVSLGAGRLDRLRWLWLPQLGLGFIASLLLALLFTWVLLSGGAGRLVAHLLP